MSLPSISIINFSRRLQDRDVQDAVRSVNRQVMEDFIPIWGNGRILRLHAPSADPEDLSSLTEEAVRGESAIYLVDEATLPGALGYHDLNTRDMPVGFVFVLNPNDWTVTLSHEVLELIIDPTVNIFVPGPDPRDPRNTVLHTYEVCDAVERTSYAIDGIRVSNFLTPSYFTVGEAIGTRNDYLGVGVRSFGVTRGSHIAFFDLATNRFETVLGQQAPQVRALARKAELYEYPKPARPSEMTLQSVLEDYHKKPHPQGMGLVQMEGITRTGRYGAAAQHMQVKRERGGGA